ncbi:thrombospondin type 3 repeat-containing protein, partial [Candidatus Nomurabacteria bacterium]|nr:thrombospondin type 3 repeat-containing protein [Candidatus Nomurabacteria bacterium]
KLNGSKIIKMFVGQTFIDPWFKAVDKEDGSLDDGILEYVYDNDGITETPERGIYRLRYGVRDSGNPTDEVLTAKAKRLVVVKNTQEIDSDEDGIPDDLDNCPSVPNEDQLDENENDIGDACENQEPTDSDEDGIEDSSDNCPSVPNEDQADADNDGIGDACDDTPNGDNNNNEEGTITTGGSSGSSGSGSSSSSNGGEVLGAFLDASSGEVLGASSSCVEYLKSYMRFGRVNSKEEVLKLQAFLNIFEGAGLKLDGVFGPNTDAAVRNLQQKYGEDILSPWGIDQSTGYVYITTKWFINNKYCPGLARPNVN